MNRATKALLLSALVFPGAGHLYLKRYRRGAALLVVTGAGLLILVVQAVQQALAIVDTLQRGDVPLDVTAISGLFSQAAPGAQGLILDIATCAVTLCWLVGIFDSYRLGKGQEAGALPDQERTGRQG